ncbi:hypothetical protein HY382_01715 [Candidatus Curtissbacteria bacterium]|nr:hypothetical protein [Candidatus Curtissbacteria bacterium]
MSKIIPTILTDNEATYHKRLLMAEHVSDLVQVDVIDGKFAANTTIDTKIIKKYPSSSNLEIQLMVVYPQNYIDDLIGCEHIMRIIVPFEGESGLPEIFYHIKNHGKQAGLSLNPSTPVAAVSHMLDDIDLLLLLAVEPGFSGQKFQEKVFDKIREAKTINPSIAIEVDGGITFDNAPELSVAGADFLAVNSTLYAADDFKVAYEKLVNLIEKARKI